MQCVVSDCHEAKSSQFVRGGYSRVAQYSTSILSARPQWLKAIRYFFSHINTLNLYDFRSAAFYYVQVYSVYTITSLNRLGNDDYNKRVVAATTWQQKHPILLPPSAAIRTCSTHLLISRFYFLFNAPFFLFFEFHDRNKEPFRLLLYKARR